MNTALIKQVVPLLHHCGRRPSRAVTFLHSLGHQLTFLDVRVASAFPLIATKSRTSF
jgi:hypothetical protein